MFSLTTLLSIGGAAIVAILAALGIGHAKGKAAGKAEMQTQVDAAKTETAAVIQQSKDADAEVKQTADSTKAVIDQTIKQVYSDVDKLPEGEAAKELQEKYSRD